MGAGYKGNVSARQVQTSSKKKFDWIAFLIWVVSIVISFVPIYAFILTWLSNKENASKGVAELLFECITHQDALWIFSTVLLFSIVNCAINFMIGKRKRKKTWLGILIILGIVDFVFLEITWGLFKYTLTDFARWPMYLGGVLIIISIIISTPMQIDFLKSEV